MKYRYYDSTKKKEVYERLSNKDKLNDKLMYQLDNHCRDRTIMYHDMELDSSGEYLNELIQLSSTHQLAKLFNNPKLINVDSKIKYLYMGILLNEDRYLKYLDLDNFDFIINIENKNYIEIFSLFYIDYPKTSNFNSLRFPYALNNSGINSFDPIRQVSKNTFNIDDINDTILIVDEESEFQRMMFLDSLNSFKIIIE